MKKIFKKLYSLKQLNEIESYNLFQNIIHKKISSIEISAALVSIKMRSISINEIIGAVKAFNKNMVFFKKPKYQFADIVGTGGDDINTINISTLSALLGSSLGLKIIKHCNKGVSSSLGSSDILKINNIKIHKSYKKIKNQLDNNNVCFIYAPNYHSGFQNVSKIRKQLNTRTIFNILGPLLNPSHPDLAVIGVYSKNLMKPISHIVRQLNYEKVMIINSDDIDEVTLHHYTNVIEINYDEISSYRLYPEDFGINKISNYYLKNNNIKKNCKIFNDICKGIGDIKYRYLISINTAVLLNVFGYDDLQKNTKIAFQELNNGIIEKHIKKIQRV
ncbi:anthranilate phosphoribosyltransferase [Buchnera aphidicola]|uniref:anthranilate phosphoribosyltransferase n=1 Tax=Buchnera aphidicola TaxID=9 RepID=UPI0034638E68